MSSILIVSPARTEFDQSEIQLLATALRGTSVELEVLIQPEPLPQPTSLLGRILPWRFQEWLVKRHYQREKEQRRRERNSPGAQQWISQPLLETVYSISINVPWEALTGAAAGVILESVRDWVADRHRARKQKIMQERSQNQVIGARFPQEPLTANIYGPSGKLLAVVYQDDRLQVPQVRHQPS